MPLTLVVPLVAAWQIAASSRPVTIVPGPWAVLQRISELAQKERLGDAASSFRTGAWLVPSWANRFLSTLSALTRIEGGNLASPVIAVSKTTTEVPTGLEHRMRWWLGWLLAFYAAWTLLNFGLGYWTQTRQHWSIAVAMALGSYVAGSTPMGGGTVGFPVLVLLFDLPASLGRNFGLLIQSIGMTSASIFILCRRIPVEHRMLRWSIAGSALGLVVGTYFVVPRVSDEAVKLIFACVWASFGMLTLVKNREMCSFHDLPSIPQIEARTLGMGVGVLGGITASLTGVGIDMMLYTLLVLLYRMDLKVAVPTSVMIMAATSVMGTGVHLWVGDLNAEVFHNWLAAAPVVIFGAPLGVYMVNLIPRLYTLYFVAVLCVLQFFWTLWEVAPTRGQWIFTVSNLVIATAGFIVLYQAGKRRPLIRSLRSPRVTPGPRAMADVVGRPGLEGPATLTPEVVADCETQRLDL